MADEKKYDPQSEAAKHLQEILAANSVNDNALVQHLDERELASQRHSEITSQPACTCNAATVPHYHGEKGIVNA